MAASVTIRQITVFDEKRRIVRNILQALPDWFGISESTDKYIEDSASQTCVAAYAGDQPIGFLCLKETGASTVELAVMGVLQSHHRQGIGMALLKSAKQIAIQAGYEFIQVKTVQMGRYEQYDQTNRFYMSLGFKELEVLPLLWDEWNPCQIYVMALR